MDEENLIRLARTAGFAIVEHENEQGTLEPHPLLFFGKLVAEAEREACRAAMREPITQHFVGQGGVDWKGDNQPPVFSWAKMKLAVLAEREACAKICDEEALTCWELGWEDEQKSFERCAAAIRARGEAE